MLAWLALTTDNHTLLAVIFSSFKTEAQEIEDEAAAMNKREDLYKKFGMKVE